MKDMREKVNGFLDGYEELCKKYGLSLEHEDTQGGFIINEYKEENVDWVRSAMVRWELDEEEMKRQIEIEERFDKMRSELFDSIGEGHRMKDEKVYTMNWEYVRDFTEEEKELNWCINILWKLLKGEFW